MYPISVHILALMLILNSPVLYKFWIVSANPISPSTSQSNHLSAYQKRQGQSESRYERLKIDDATGNLLFKGQQFLPFYVPTGSQVLYANQRSDQLIFTGQGWKQAKPEHDSGKETTNTGDSIEFSWTGEDVECFGFKAGQNEKGVSRIGIYLDGIRQSTDDELRFDEGETYKQQLIFRVTYLARTRHTLKIIHEGREGELLSIFAFVTTNHTTGEDNPNPTLTDRSLQLDNPNIRRAESDQWKLVVEKVETGVTVQQIMVVSDTEAIILDKVEHNPLTVNGHPAWASIYNFKTHRSRPLDSISNVFCGGGSFLGNGTMIHVGGNPPENNGGDRAIKSLDGLNSIRFFTPCSNNSKSCELLEYPNKVFLSDKRWYPTTVRLTDGSVIIVGGSKSKVFRNSEGNNNPTVEFYPPKKSNFGPVSVKTPFKLDFLVRTLKSNLFPIVIVLPITDTLFIAANNDAILWNWRTGVETRLPPIPNKVIISYPTSGSAVLLPLTLAKNFQPEVFICGGSTIPDTKPKDEIKLTDKASDQCERMLLTKEGIAKGWEVERMPQPRILLDLITMPDGKVLIVNGAQSGVDGYGDLQVRAGQSNADNPTLQPVLYDPAAPAGSRFSSKGIPTSTIPRMYHSSATLTPSGQVMIAGSNPNNDRTTTGKYPTEYRAEFLSPPYILKSNRPAITDLPARGDYGEIIRITVSGVTNLDKAKVTAVLIDFGFITHGVHMNSRHVELKNNEKPSPPNQRFVQLPTRPEIYPPGYGWIFLMIDGVCTEGRRIMIGSGKLNTPPRSGGLTGAPEIPTRVGNVPS